ncbi:MAG: hypothetical protein IKO47_05385 [Ruminococcus sp.]|nr:hypothetical protein [Ruminococcus sp.]
MKKYAIFRSPTGMYYHEYIEKLEQLEGTELEGLVNEDQLPIVLDGSGGYFRFEFGNYRFVRIIESDKEYPLELEEMFYKNDPDFKLGWMSPSGDTYSCSYTNHNKCAFMIARKFFPKAKYPEPTLLRAGWIKIIDSWDGTERHHGQFVYAEARRLTRGQINALFDLGLYDNAEVKELLENSY